MLGWSYPLANQFDDKSVIDRLYEQGQIKKRVSCIKARTLQTSKSEFIIGGCDVEADSWLPVLKINDQYTGWRVNLTKVVIRSKEDNSELLTIETNNEAVLDTGAGDVLSNEIEWFFERKKKQFYNENTSFIHPFKDMPTKFMDLIANQLAATNNGEHYLVACANRTSLPNIDFYFGEAKITTTAEDYSWTYNVSIIFSKSIMNFMRHNMCTFFFQVWKKMHNELIKHQISAFICYILLISVLNCVYF